MSNPLAMKLEQFTSFDQAERERLNELLTFPTQTYARGKEIIAQGEKVRDIHLVLTGLAARSKTLANGEHQIMALLIPGDLCDVEVFILEAMDHSITAISDTTCVLIPATVIEDLLSEHTKLTKALWWSTMTDSAILREWIVGHGSRDARERLAHLFCEMLIRYRVVAETTDNTFPFPLTQEELAAATGMTTVHVNRTLQQLRSEGLVDLERKIITILDPKRLQKVAQYEANYLHLIRTQDRDKEVAGRAGDLVASSDRGFVQSAAEMVKSAFKGSST